MSLEMNQGSFDYAGLMLVNNQKRVAFFKFVWGDDDTPSELFRGVMKMMTKYVEHARVEAGDRWSHDAASYETSLWMSYAAYILAGLYAIYGRTFPNIRPGLVEKMEKDCDTLEKLSEREARLYSFGEVSKNWIDHFRRCTDDDFDFSNFYLCVHGIAYIYVLGAAIIYEMEDMGDDALLPESDHRDIAGRMKRLDPGIKNALEEILEKMKF